MKKRLIAIASLMFCLAVGTVVSYADAPDDEKGQVVVGESVTEGCYNWQGDDRRY